MVCKKCKAEIQDDSNFCPLCGASTKTNILASVKNFVDKYIDRWSIGTLLAIIISASALSDFPINEFADIIAWLVVFLTFNGIVLLGIKIYTMFRPQSKPSSFYNLKHAFTRRKKKKIDTNIENDEAERYLLRESSEPQEKSPPAPMRPVRTISQIDLIDRMEGPKFEQFIVELLCRLGYENVRQTGGSGDQGVDVLAEKDGVQYAIQCKRYSHALGNTPIQEVNAGRQHYGCHVGVVVTNNYFTVGAKELASSCKVLLWDRDKLVSMLRAASMEIVTIPGAYYEPDTDSVIEPQSGAVDPLLFEAARVVCETQMASTTLLQRRLRIGYAKAARLIDILEELNIIGPFEGAKPRAVLLVWKEAEVILKSCGIRAEPAQEERDRENEEKEIDPRNTPLKGPEKHYIISEKIKEALLRHRVVETLDDVAICGGSYFPTRDSYFVVVTYNHLIFVKINDKDESMDSIVRIDIDDPMVCDFYDPSTCKFKINKKDIGFNPVNLIIFPEQRKTIFYEACKLHMIKLWNTNIKDGHDAATVAVFGYTANKS